jgi:hypothetical protein
MYAQTAVCGVAASVLEPDLASHRTSWKFGVPVLLVGLALSLRQDVSHDMRLLLAVSLSLTMTPLVSFAAAPQALYLL